MPEIKERPILFNAPMVCAILEGRKSVTRRIVKPQYETDVWSVHPAEAPRHDRHSHDWWLPTGTLPYAALPKCPYGKPGERLWVREAFGSQVRRDTCGGTGRFTVYRASNPGAIDFKCASGKEYPVKWKPSIHMPRHLSRISVEITDIRVERLQGITTDQALAEGIQPFGDGNGFHLEEGKFYTDHPVESFAGLWQSISGEESWHANPWVWVVEFKRVTP